MVNGKAPLKEKPAPSWVDSESDDDDVCVAGQLMTVGAGTSRDADDDDDNSSDDDGEEEEDDDEAITTAEPPPKKRKVKLKGAKGVPASWHEPSQPYPKRGEPKLKGKRYYTEEKSVREYWRCDDGKQRYPICVCTPDGLCGLVAQSKTRPGYADACATREDRKAQYEATKQANGGALPAWKSKEEHKGKDEEFVMHRGKECLTRKSNGEARPLCACDGTPQCFLACSSFKQTHAIGCVHNTGAKCDDCKINVAVVGKYCNGCAKERGATAQRKAAQQPALEALLAKHPGMEEAPEDPDGAFAGRPYGQLNVQKNGSRASSSRWARAQRHGTILAARTG